MIETPQAESSTADEVDVFNGQDPTMAEYDAYRKSGEVPARFQAAQPADPAPADDPEETDPEGEDPEAAPDSDPEDDQEQVVPEKTAKRIKDLLAERHELRTKLAAVEKKDVPPAPSAAQPQYAFPKPTIDDKNADGTPKYGVYEDFTEALGRWAAKEERTSWEREQAEKQAVEALKATLDEARSRYEDADEVIFPAGEAIRTARIPLAVKEVFAQSDNFIDLCYVVGSDPKELESFIALAQKNPRAAIGKVFEYERGIAEEMAKPRDASGKFAASEPNRTRAPKPPSPVGGSSSRAFDVSDDSLSPEEWMRKRNAQVAQKA
jgi:hypothetical protein